jgi:hypothetical protein
MKTLFSVLMIFLLSTLLVEANEVRCGAYEEENIKELWGYWENKFPENDGVYWIVGQKADTYLVMTAQYYAMDVQTKTKRLHSFQVIYSCVNDMLVEDRVYKWVIR